MEEKKGEQIFIEATNGYLCEIQEKDIEKLRLWKNATRQSFFFQDIITEEMQKRWYEGYKARRIKNEDFLFLVKEKKNDHAIGCMGFRLENGKIDLYNIIRGEASQGDFTMKSAMITMLGFIRANTDKMITCKVLLDNPAVEWYKKTGFTILEATNDYYTMTITADTIK